MYQVLRKNVYLKYWFSLIVLTICFTSSKNPVRDQLKYLFVLFFCQISIKTIVQKLK